MVTWNVDTLNSRLTTAENVLSATVSKVAKIGVSTAVPTVAALKAATANAGDIIQTQGYYAAGDNGHGTYKIVSSGTADDGLIIALDNGKFAQLIHNGTIYARQYGVKLDGVTDDTARLNAFFKLFGTVKLVVDNGIAKTTSQLLLKGRWGNADSNLGTRRLTFKLSAIKYAGTAGSCIMQVYNHEYSNIEGFTTTSDSVDGYVNFACFWYSEFNNFYVRKIAFNKTNANIGDTLIDTGMYTNTFRKGLVQQEVEFYGNGVANAGMINSMSFYDVLFSGNQSTTQYNMKFYGTGFENIRVFNSDLSYATVANLYIDVAQTSMALTFEGCYFDSAIPLIAGMDYKGARISITDSREASQAQNQLALVKTVNALSMHRTGVIGNEADNIPKGCLNLMKNGDLLYKDWPGWIYLNGAATRSITANANAINGNSLTVTFNSATGQYVSFYSIPLPFTGVYTAIIRLKKTGQGIVQWAIDPVYIPYDLSGYADGEELILSTNSRGTVLSQGTAPSPLLACVGLTSATLVVEILEIILVQGTHIAFNLPIHPQANIYPTSGATTSRPAPYKVGQMYFDTTLNKPTFCKIVSPAAWVDSAGTAV